MIREVFEAIDRMSDAQCIALYTFLLVVLYALSRLLRRHREAVARAKERERWALLMLTWAIKDLGEDSEDLETMLRARGVLDAARAIIEDDGAPWKTARRRIVVDGELSVRRRGETP